VRDISDDASPLLTQRTDGEGTFSLGGIKILLATSDFTFPLLHNNKNIFGNKFVDDREIYYIV
jgi:hypothetical protein